MKDRLQKNILTKDGCRIYYSYLKRRKTCLVLLHGWVMNHTAMDLIKDHFLKKGHSILTLDLRGHGQSHSRNISFELATQDIRQLISHLKIKSFIIIGFSMGGMLAQKYYLSHPKGVKGMVLINTNVIDPSKTLAIANLRLVLDFVKRIREVMQDKNRKLYLSKAMFEMFSKAGIAWKAAYTAYSKLDRKRFDPIDRNDFIHFTKLKNTRDVSVFYEGLCRTDLAVAEKYYIEQVRFNTLTDLRKITIPCLIIASAKDVVCPPTIARFMSRGIKDSELHILENSDHLSILQEPRKINLLIDKFLARLESGKDL